MNEKETNINETGEQSTPAPAENKSGRVCPNCNSPVPEQNQFCVNCGVFIEQKAPEASLPATAEGFPAEAQGATTENGPQAIVTNEDNKEVSPNTKEETKNKKKKNPFWRTLLISLCLIFLSFAMVVSALILASGMKNTAVIYENATWENPGEPVDEDAIVNAAAKASPSVVAITTESVTYGSYYGNYVTEGAGSGVICTADGYIITNHHVVDGATTIHVTLANGDTHEAEFIGSDSLTDLAVIRINANGLKPAVFCANGSTKVGQSVIAIGNPLGTLSNTVTDGIVSALARQVVISGSNMTLLQHNAAVSPGNSGGGLFNMNGELVGIVNAKYSGEAIEGISFAIPMETLRPIVKELIENGYVSGRPFIGITVSEVLTLQDLYSLSDEFRICVEKIKRYGVYVQSDSSVQYTENSPHLKAGDYISSIDGQTINDMADISTFLATTEVGQTVNLTIYRYNSETDKTEQLQVSIVLTERTE